MACHQSERRPERRDWPLCTLGRSPAGWSVPPSSRFGPRGSAPDPPHTRATHLSLADVLAFSPGFAAPAEVRGSPRVFLSHGRADAVLPIERCGRRLARGLRQAGYDLDYREFAGGHVVPSDMVEAAFARFTGRAAREAG